MKNMYDVIILGAGASGLMCAATAAARNKHVLLVDHANTPGRKLLITGGGKGNITNTTITPEHFAGENPLFCRSALAGFSPSQLLDSLHEARIPFEEREEGQIFCRRSAADMLEFLLKASARCRFALGEAVTAVEHPWLASSSAHNTAADSSSPLFTVRTSSAVHAAPSLVIATGGPAWPQVGATDFGLALARQFGHRIVQPRPVLVGLTLPVNWPLAGLAGISCRVSITLTDADAQLLVLTPAKGNTKKGLPHPHAVHPHPSSSVFLNNSLPPQGIVAHNIPLLFTHRGISGPAALQASLYWQPGLTLRIDFLPEQSLEVLLAAKDSGRLLAGNLLKRFLPERLCEALVPHDLRQKKTAELSRLQRNALCEALHRHIAAPTGTEGLKKAEATSGGVSTEKISSSTLQSKRMPGLYFCGEVLDITGRLGGYNLHWAFSSGKLVGESVP